jgi:DNA-binding transcriptional LysR family regulator
MPTTLRQIEVFRLIMLTRNLTEAARLLGVSQPAVSQSLKELETQLGLTLFVRFGSRISPTGEARLLLPEAERLLGQMGVLQGRAIELRDAGAGSLQIASMPNVAACILPAAVTSFLRERPRVNVKLNAHIIREVVRQVRQEGADLGFVYAPVDDPAVAIEPILQAPMVCVLRPDHRLAARAQVELTDLADEQVILLDTLNTPGLYLHRCIEESGVRIKRAVETNLSFAALSMVRSGAGIFVTDPIVLLSGFGQGLVIREVRPTIAVDLVAIYARQRPVPRLAVRFMAHLKPAAVELCAVLRDMGCEASIGRGSKGSVVNTET